MFGVAPKELVSPLAGEGNGHMLRGLPAKDVEAES